MLRFHATALFTLFFVLGVPVRNKLHNADATRAVPADARAWVDSVFNAMTDDERLGQLFMIRVNRKPSDPEGERLAEELIERYHVGGICFFKGHPSHQLGLTNHYQALSKTPLLVAIDGEWGLSMRLDSTVSYPHNLALGAIRQNRLIYRLGAEIADDCRRMGIHVNFAPVADVNNNPNNPVINDRSFGENKYKVSAKSFMYMLGMQDNGVMACAKHFPGHGDTDVDSHLDLPVIRHSRSRLDSVELYPFKVLINQGVKSIMVAHLQIPALDTSAHRPTTLSRHVVTDLLQDSLKFGGLIFTDGLEMKGVTKYFKPGEVEAEAILAGNDILLLPGDTPAAFETIKRYIREGKLSWERIYKSTKKILLAKYQLGLHDYHPKPLDGLIDALNRPQKRVLKRELIARSLTLARSEDELVPVRKLLHTAGAVLSIGAKKRTKFQDRVVSYADFAVFNTERDIAESRRRELVRRLSQKDLVIIGLHGMNRRPSKNFGISGSAVRLITELAGKTKVILVVFGNPYSLKNFESLRNVLVAYQDDDDTQDLAAQALFGAIHIMGQLPVTASPGYVAGQGIPVRSIQRFGYALPEAVDMDSKVLARIDTILGEMVRSKAAPGAQVLVARRDKIVYHKAYGYHTYAKRRPVRLTDVYDLASVTKVAATTPALMKLYDEGRFSTDVPLVTYLPEAEGTNKADLLTGDILSHHARLRPWIPFYKRTLVSVRRGRRRHRYRVPSKRIYHKRPGTGFTVPVAKDFYMKDSYVDSIWQWIYASPLREKAGYRYSDLGFYLLGKAVEHITGRPLNEYVKEEIYKPLQLRKMTYLPLKCLDGKCLVPTERDRYFRKRVIKGYVHDMGAAMLGGVSGHAGLFSDSYDLAVLFQMYLNGGTYGGVRVLSPEVIRHFATRVPGETRRGLGFDLKELAPNPPARKENTSPLASDATFGHLGFTGTCVWADPEEELVYVFLSNRTYPSMHNYKLNKENIRPRIQTVIYQSLLGW